uniref:monofunctional biosynthetic peptidoglycan transglycosylase n=1 Tax=Orrella sp. TaxID=1921583 RepID=UPI0040475A03
MWWWFKRAFLLLFGLFFLYQLTIATQVVWFRWFDPQSTAFIDAERRRLATLDPPQQINQRWVNYQDISVNAKRAVISAEDTGFVDHAGIEWEAIERAMLANAESGSIRFGGSTITMQLAKNLFLSSDRSYVRKAQEIAIALLIDVVMDKPRILELYLNVAEWGAGVFGIEAAAQHYFGRSASRLTARQAAWLAAILPSPKRYDLNRQSRWVDRRTGIIMRRMPQVAVPE